MWFLVSARLRRWVVASIAVPLAGAAAGRLAASVERHRGRGAVSRSLRAVQRASGRHTRSLRRARKNER